MIIILEDEDDGDARRWAEWVKDRDVVVWASPQAYVREMMLADVVQKVEELRESWFHNGQSMDDAAIDAFDEVLALLRKRHLKPETVRLTT